MSLRGSGSPAKAISCKSGIVTPLTVARNPERGQGVDTDLLSFRYSLYVISSTLEQCFYIIQPLWAELLDLKVYP